MNPDLGIGLLEKNEALTGSEIGKFVSEKAVTVWMAGLQTMNLVAEREDDRLTTKGLQITDYGGSRDINIGENISELTGGAYGQRMQYLFANLNSSDKSYAGFFENIRDEVGVNKVVMKSSETELYLIGRFMDEYQFASQNGRTSPGTYMRIVMQSEADRVKLERMVANMKQMKVSNLVKTVACVGVDKMFETGGQGNPNITRTGFDAFLDVVLKRDLLVPKIEPFSEVELRGINMLIGEI